MKPSTRLSSAVFQLTPTRTRCDLIVVANGKKEKIASGLLTPFLAHLKTARDQVDKGGYSILLEPEIGGGAGWFTKGTVERFVRFVSTPEIMERVYMLETEILQIEEAIAMQSNKDLGQNIVEDHQGKPSAGCEGSKTLPPDDKEKAIVLYKPGAQPSEGNGSCSQGGNSKVQLLKVLETRKMVLQKEQGMAFARAAAAGFDVDQIQPLVSFAECFGAMRLMEACSRFMNLWKTKHETGQWLEMEASEGLSTRSDFYAINSSGGVLPATPHKHIESNHELAFENSAKSCSTNSADNPVQNGNPEFRGQFPHLMFPPWAMHAPSGGQPVFPAYPMQGMPYYQAYAAHNPFFQPSHKPMEHSGQDGRDSNIASQTLEIERTRSLDSQAAELSLSRKSRKMGGKSNKKQPGMVVIRNVNYITSKENNSGSESTSNSDSVTDSDNEDSKASGHVGTKKRSVNNTGSHPNNVEVSKFDDGHWQIFQNCLLRGNDEDYHTDSGGMFAMEKDVKVKRLVNTGCDDPLARDSQNAGDIHDTRMCNVQSIGASTVRRPRQSGDATFLSRADTDYRGTNGQTDSQFPELNGRKILPRTTHEDNMIGSQQHTTCMRNSSDPLVVNGFEGATKMDRDSSQKTTDETFIVPFRSLSIDQAEPTSRTVVDSEIPSMHQKFDFKGNGNVINYEPSDLSLMPERGTEKGSAGYDLALEYEMHVCPGGSQEKRKEEATDGKGLRKLDRDPKSKKISGSLQKQQSGGPVRKGKSSKMTPLEDARERAEKLRSYKAEMQKLKKEKDEAEAKRLEALKLERQKRIAARSGSTAAKQATISPQTKQLPTKLSPATKRGSKFSDSEPGSSSPLQRSKIKTSLGSSDQLKASKATKSSGSSKLTGNKLTGFSSSLSGIKKEHYGVTPDSKASIARIRRLSEPKIIISPPITSMKARSAESVAKRKLYEGPERNKISAIIDLDRTKSATLPELKIKAPKPYVKTGEKQSMVMDGQNFNGIKPSALCESSGLNSSNCNARYQIDADDSPIVEKNVVILEYEKPSLSALRSSDTNPEKRNQLYDDCAEGEKSNVISADTHAVPSSKDQVSGDPKNCQLEKRSNPIEVRIACPEKDLPNNTPAGKPYGPPYSHVSSLEDPCTDQSCYSKAPMARTELGSGVEETARERVPDVKTLKIDKNSATSERTFVKESSKGLKRLLKFGKKNPSSPVDPSVDGSEHKNDKNAAGISAVHMLKNLISLDETSHAGSASQKTSRHFSLFSPFRSKASEKKQTP